MAKQLVFPPMHPPHPPHPLRITALILAVLGLSLGTGLSQQDKKKSFPDKFQEKWEKEGPNVRIKRHQDGSRTVFRRSPNDRTLVKRTWGEQVTANVGFGLLNLVLVLPAIALVFVGGSLGTAGAVITIPIAVVWFVAVSAVVATLTGIFQTALYRQATGRTVPTEFDATQLRQSFS